MLSNKQKKVFKAKWLHILIIKADIYVEICCFSIRNISDGEM